MSDGGADHRRRVERQRLFRRGCKARVIPRRRQRLARLRPAVRLRKDQAVQRRGEAERRPGRRLAAGQDGQHGQRPRLGHRIPRHQTQRPSHSQVAQARRSTFRPNRTLPPDTLTHIAFSYDGSGKAAGTKALHQRRRSENQDAGRQSRRHDEDDRAFQHRPSRRSGGAVSRQRR